VAHGLSSLDLRPHRQTRKAGSHGRAEYQHWAKLLDGIGLAIPSVRLGLARNGFATPQQLQAVLTNHEQKCTSLVMTILLRSNALHLGKSLPTIHLFCGVQSHSKRAQVYSRRRVKVRRWVNLVGKARRGRIGA
jgi:hypothetical protein